MSNQDLQRIITEKVRLSFVHLFTPYARDAKKEPKFSVTLLIPKSDFATKQRVDQAINAAVVEGTGKAWHGVRPPLIHMPIHDGDGVKPSDGMPFGPECKGHWVMTASSKANQRPDIVDINLNPIMNQSEIYSGVYARVSIRFFAYSAEGKKGIGCGLGNVQKLEDGEPLGGSGRSAASDFGGGDAYAPPAPTYQQQPGYPPQQGYGAPQMPAAYPPAAPAYPPVAPAYPVQPQQPPGYPPQQPPTPGYPPQQGYGMQPAQAPQPGYGQQPAAPSQPAYPPQQGYGAPQQPQQIDPITGKPLNGGIMGL